MYAPAEDLPAELDGLADEIHVHFPWGSLLRAVAEGSEKVLGNMRRIARQGGWLEVVIGVDEERDATELQRLRLPSLSEDYVRSTLAARYAAAG